LSELSDKGIISNMLYQQSDEVRLWANVVGHEDFDPDALTPTACEDAVYVQPTRLTELRKLREQAKKGDEG